MPSHSFHTCDPEEEENFSQGSAHSQPVTYKEAKRLCLGGVYIPSILHYADINLCRCLKQNFSIFFLHVLSACRSLSLHSYSTYNLLTIKNTFNIAFHTIATAYYHSFFAYLLTINS